MATENDLESLEMECVEEVDDSEEWEDFSEESDDEDGFDRLDLTYADDEGEVGELGEDQDDEPEPEERVVHARPRNPVEAELLPRPYLHEPLPLLGNDDEGGNDGDAPHELDPERLENNNWCLCGGRCQLHPSFVLGDCVCCREIPEVRAEGDVQGVSCITDAASFEAAILDPVSLYIGWNHYTEKWRRQARSFQQRNNEKYRYVAYRQFVRWCWSVLGKDIRVQLPACVQAKIKNSYPDRAGTYKGTILRPLNL